ncbi:hypothetical protein ACFOGI_04250 [Virgibacillus xinjiangensis]|uniref:Sporadically distributed protein, TIGR04141 family n=1 Tax=Virgibacillus xinjiangensis TaxID=393090 RepID=A0ABV7CSS9_9BACI
MIDRLILSETAYFYNLQQKLNNNFIKHLFIDISRKKSGPYATKIINQQYTISGKNLTYSLCIFKYKDTPNFLDDEGNEVEIKFAYLLLIQYSGMLVVNKRNVSSLNSKLEKYITDVDVTTISRLFLNEKTSYEKFSLRNMDINDKAIRNRNIEANDLRISYNPIYSSKYILNNMRIKDGNKKISLGLSTSKINRLGKKVAIEDYFEYVIDVVDRIESFELKESYLDNFSTPIPTENLIKELEPKSILFLFNDLLNDFENGMIDDVRYGNPDNGRSIDLHKYLEEFNSYCEILKKDTRGNAIHRIVNSIDKSLILKKNKTSITLGCKKLRKIFLIYNGETINLQEYLNKNQSFIVTFSDMEIVYSNKKLFKDNKLLQNLDSFLEVLVPYDELTSITAEKGNTSKTSSKFEENTLFDFIESNIAYDIDYLICDDLGNEFADFISILDSKKISYYHAKHGNSQLSASDFQIVIGQAIKNIGNMNMSPNDLKRKIERWGGKISGTNIPLIRKGNSTEEVHVAFSKTQDSPNSMLEIFIVVNFLSKSRLEEELNKLKNGDSAQHQVIQILWLLSSFISTCKEMGIIVHITCLP